MPQAGNPRLVVSVGEACNSFRIGRYLQIISPISLKIVLYVNTMRRRVGLTVLAVLNLANYTRNNDHIQGPLKSSLDHRSLPEGSIFTSVHVVLFYNIGPGIQSSFGVCYSVGTCNWAPATWCRRVLVEGISSLRWPAHDAGPVVFVCMHLTANAVGLK